MHNFCTYFDQHYLTRGLALYRSLRQHCPSFRLWVLCMDDASHEALEALNLPEARLISLAEFERNDTELLQAKASRSRVEYYFTCTPSLPLFILNRHLEIDCITYLDADLYFYADPQPLFGEMGDQSIAIIAHRFPPYLRHMERSGIYNVGWLTFRRDDRALACLRWWRQRCIEWCYDREEDGKFGDQKYLDDWPTRFQGVTVIHHKGANLALWNLANYALSVEDDSIQVDDQPLIFFHFHGLKQIRQNVFQLNQAHYHLKISGLVRNRLYHPYIETLLEERRQISPLVETKGVASLRKSAAPQTRSLKDRIVNALRVIRSLLTHDYIVVWGNRAM